MLKKRELSLWEELEDLYYEENSDQWAEAKRDSDMRATGQEYIDILDGNASQVSRLNNEREVITDKYIKRGKRKIWEIGDIVHVTGKMDTEINHNPPDEEEKTGTHEQTIRPGKSLGQIRLVKIIPGELESIMIFEKVSNE